MLLVRYVVACFLVLNIICAVGRTRHKESMIAEGMTGISFLIKIMCIIFFGQYIDYSYNMMRDGGRNIEKKSFLFHMVLLLFLLILLLSGYIRKRAAIYRNINCIWNERKHKYRFVLFEYLGIVGFSII